METTDTLLDSALKFAANGVSVLPVSLATKAPMISWAKYMNEIMDTTTIGREFSGCNGEHGVAMICGAVSRNLELLDFDNKAHNAQSIFHAFLSIPEVHDIFTENEIPYESSPSGGFHAWYRIESAVAKTQKLARAQIERDGKIENVTTIETKGEGGYGICDPSRGYVVQHGSLDAIPTISVEDRDVLLSYCRTFDKLAKQNDEHKKVSNGGDDTRPGTAYSSDPANQAEVLQLLKDAGWKEAGRYEGAIRLQRPGKERGTSAVLHDHVLNVFSTNAEPFETDRGYSLFSVFSILKHNSDFSAAARELVGRGLGVAARIAEDEPESFIEMVPDLKNKGFKYRINYVRFMELMSAHGYRFFAHGKDVRILKISRNIVEEVLAYDIAIFAASLITDEKAKNYLIENEAKLFTPGKFVYLERQPDDFNCSSATTGYLYFENSVVRVTKGATDFEIIDYGDLLKPVWKKKIIPQKIIHGTDPTLISEIARFVWNVSGCTEKKFYRFMAGIGYLLHEYKQSSTTKAVICLDAAIPESEDDANGGTGKSILAKFICHYRNACVMGGKALDFNATFFYQQVDYDTGIILFDDVNKKFPFDHIFNVITGDLTVEKKNLPAFTIPFNQSPKIIITNNHAIQGTGGSFERRKFELEFVPHYTNKFTPRQEFGHDLMDEWSEEEWNLANIFAIECLQRYLNDGLPKDEEVMTSARFRQLIGEAGQAFVEFIMDEIESGRLATGLEFDRRDLFNRYKTAIDDTGMEKAQTFTKRLSKFTTIFQLKHSTRKSNGIRWMTYHDDLLEVLRCYRNHTK